MHYQKVGRLYMLGFCGHAIKRNLKTVSLKAFITRYHSSSSVLMMNMPTGRKKHREVLNQKVTRWLNCFLSFFFYFRQASSLCDYFTNGLHTKLQQHFTLSTAPAHRLFTTFEVSHKAL